MKINIKMTDQQALQAIHMPKLKENVANNVRNCIKLEYDNKDLKKEMKNVKELLKVLMVEQMPNMIWTWGLDLGQATNKLTEIDTQQNYGVKPISPYKKQVLRFDNALIYLQNAINIINGALPEWLIQGKNNK